MLTAWVEVGEAEGTGGVCMSKRKGKPTDTGRRTGWRQGKALEAGFLVRGRAGGVGVCICEKPWIPVCQLALGGPDWSFPFVAAAATLLPFLSFPLDVPEFPLVV